MFWGAEELFGWSDLDNPASIHHGDIIRDMPDDGKIVGDEQVGEPEFLLQIL